MIIFSNFAATKMACLNMKMSDRVTAAISGKSVEFNINGGKLIFTKNNKTVMVLKHID
jgi:hypothetical protein